MLDKIIIEDINSRIESFKGSLSINEHGLQTECSMQPVLLADAGELKSKVTKLCDETKSALDIVKAEVETAVRTNPEKYGLVKTTEGSIANAVILDSKYKEAKDDYIQACELSNFVSSLYEAIRGRRSAISDLVTLFVNKYYSEVDAPSRDSLRANQREKIAAMRNEKEKED